jgi:enoyl-CoA hydratase/carnithine racemase
MAELPGKRRTRLRKGEMGHGTVLLDVAGPVATITLNRPEVLNAANLAFSEDFETVVDAVAAEPDVRVVLVRGAGRAFSAGLDLDMQGGSTAPKLLEFFERQERTRSRLEALDQITIAAVHGYCVGGGLQLAIACDIRVCSIDCKLGLPAVLEGIIPGMAPVRLPRLIGLGPARRLVLSGELVAAEEALRLGMVDYVVPAERFEEETAAVVETYLKVPPAAARASKRLMRRAFEEPLATLEAEMLPMIEACLDSPEAAAAAQAWRDRRAARDRQREDKERR